jgi:hypothetical protein
MAKRGRKGPLSDEHKQKLKEGRERARKEKLEFGIPLRRKKGEVKYASKLVTEGFKVKLKLPANPHDAFDYKDIIRSTCRRLGDYLSAPKIIKEICDPKIWRNIILIETILQKYFILA